MIPSHHLMVVTMTILNLLMMETVRILQLMKMALQGYLTIILALNKVLTTGAMRGSEEAITRT